jgi:hypothetical protein
MTAPIDQKLEAKASPQQSELLFPHFALFSPAIAKEFVQPAVGALPGIVAEQGKNLRLHET